MNMHYLLPALLAFAAASYAGQAAAAVPTVETAGTPAFLNCPATLAAATIFHFDKVVFSISSVTGAAQLQAASPNDQPALDALPRNTELDIKIRDNPRAVADLRSKVLTFLGAQPSATNKSFVKIIQVAYEAVLCPKAP